MRHLNKFNTISEYTTAEPTLSIPNLSLILENNSIGSVGDYNMVAVEYLEGTGTQYIDTGVYGYMNHTYEIDFNQIDTNNYRIWGVLGQQSYIGYNMSFTYGSSTWMVRWESTSNGQNNIGLGSINTQKHNIKISNGEIYFDNLNKGISVGHNSNFVINFNIFLFTINPANTTPSSNAKVRIYSYKDIDENGNLVRDFIPVRVGNVGYMFDKVSKKLFANSGTGNFTLGQDIHVVEYLENTSTSRIHTGISGNLRAVGYAVSNQIKGSSQCLLCGHTTSGWFGEAVSTRKWGVTSGASGCAAISPTTPVTFDINYGSQVTGTINGINITFSNGTARNEWAIFGSTSGSYPFVGKLYWLKFYQNNILVRDFIPVKVNNVGYMYDKVSRQLFGNVGSGSFTCGSEDSKRKITRTK